MVLYSRYVINRKFQWPEVGLICKPFSYSIDTQTIRLSIYTVCKKFAVQTHLWSVEFVIHNISQGRHHGSPENYTLPKHFMFSFSKTKGSNFSESQIYLPKGYFEPIFDGESVCNLDGKLCTKQG